MAVKTRSAKVTKAPKATAASKSKKTAVEPVEEPVEQEQEEEKEEEDFDLPSSDSESEDEEESDSEQIIRELEQEPVASATTTTTTAGHSITTSTKKSHAKKQAKTTPGVLYIGRLPQGFEEKELKQYFEQFGDILQLRLSRNKKTGRSKHYAFLQFADLKVAEIAQDTMNNYLLMGHQLKVTVLKPEQIHEDLFKGANKKFRTVDWSKLNYLKTHAPKSESKLQKLQKKHESNKVSKQNKLKAQGIDYDISDI